MVVGARRRAFPSSRDFLGTKVHRGCRGLSSSGSIRDKSLRSDFLLNARAVGPKVVLEIALEVVPKTLTAYGTWAIQY